MASSGKPKTTMAKLKREATLRERRLDKAARKEIRKQGQPYTDRPGYFDADPPEPGQVISLAEDLELAPEPEPETTLGVGL